MRITLAKNYFTGYCEIPYMRRRTFFTAAPALLAGCLGTGADQPPTRSPRTPTDSPTSVPTTVAETTPTPSFPPASMPAEAVREQLADHGCEALSDLPAICPDEDDARLDVAISPQVGELPTATVEFRIENRADESFEWGPYNWRLQQWDESRWRRIAPFGRPIPLNRIKAGESYTYRIGAVEDKLLDNRTAHAADKDISLGGLGPGVYGFTTEGFFESTPDDELAVGAVFGFAGEAPPIRPTDAVTEVSRDGSELVVHGDAAADERAELIVSFVAGEPGAQLLATHVRQLAALLNTLSFAPTNDVRTIRYVGREDDIVLAHDYLDWVTPDGTARYGFRDLVFEATIGE